MFRPIQTILAYIGMAVMVITGVIGIGYWQQTTHISVVDAAPTANNQPAPVQAMPANQSGDYMDRMNALLAEYAKESNQLAELSKGSPWSGDPAQREQITAAINRLTSAQQILDAIQPPAESMVAHMDVLTAARVCAQGIDMMQHALTNNDYIDTLTARAGFATAQSDFDLCTRQLTGVMAQLKSQQ